MSRTYIQNKMTEVKLGEILQVKHGWAFKGEYFSEIGQQSILTPGNFFESGGFKPNTGKERYYIGSYPEEYLCKKGDLIVAMTQQAEGLLGSTAIVPEDNKYLHNQRIGLITCDETKAYPLFVYFLFMTKTVREQIERTSSGTKVKHTSPEKIYDVKVPIPNISNQRKIAALLISIEHRITSNKKINDNLEQMAKTIYDYWFTQFDFPDENGKPYRSSGGQMVWNEQVKREIPVDWEVKTLSQIMQKNAKPFDYLSVQAAVDLSIMPSNSISITQLNSSKNFTTNLFEMKKGDILFGSIRPYLHKAGIAPCDGVVAGTVHSYRVLKDYDYNFALFTITRPSFFDYAVNVSSGTKMPVVSSDALLSYKVPYSESVARKFAELSIQKPITENAMESQMLNEIRDWLLPMLMNGQANVFG